MGFRHEDCGHQQSKHFHKIKENNVSATTWGMNLIQYLWEQGKKAWKIRNDLVHDDGNPAEKT